jgi:hypothetical protein
MHPFTPSRPYGEIVRHRNTDPDAQRILDTAIIQYQIPLCNNSRKRVTRNVELVLQNRYPQSILYAHLDETRAVAPRTALPREKT